MKILKGVLFWIISLTWGGLMTYLGLIISLVLLIAGYKPKKFGYGFYFEIGNNWGGLELGAVFLANNNPSLHLKQHEAGHGIQNLMLGAFMPFVISIPSAVRYHYRKWLVKTGRKKITDLSDYDSIWFEKWATKSGKKHFK